MMTRARQFLSTCKKIAKGYLHLDIVSNCNHTQYTKRCLLIYITHPFLSSEGEDYHQNIWQARELARIIGEFGYQVDVIDYRNRYTRPVGKYDMVIGLIPRGIDVYSKHLTDKAVRIAYLTSSNLEFTNSQEKQRLQDLYERRGVRLQPRRQAGKIDSSIESFNGALFFGNDYNLTSYSSFRMPPVYYLANNGYEYSFTVRQDKNPRKFIFFGSMGQVHKGLDLLLEIFSFPGFPCELFVCGSVEGEEDFVREYHRELYDCPNIHLIGFVDIHSKRFEELVKDCAFSVLPSCAEGQAGSVTTLMSAGVISICSKECGFNDDEVINLPDCRPETIRNAVLTYSGMDQEWVKNNSEKAVNVYRTRFTKECYTRSVYAGLKNILRI